MPERRRTRASAGRRGNARALARTGALLGLGLALAVLENSLLPLFALPIPGAKPGLANLSVLVALAVDGCGAAAAVSLLRVALAGIFGGTIGAVPFWLSLGGAVASLAGMAAARRLPGISPIGISVVGAVCHNLGQLAALAIVLPNAAAPYLIPWLILLGLPAGTITGYLGRKIVGRMEDAGRT